MIHSISDNDVKDELIRIINCDTVSIQAYDPNWYVCWETYQIYNRYEIFYDRDVDVDADIRWNIWESRSSPAIMVIIPNNSASDGVTIYDNDVINGIKDELTSTIKKLKKAKRHSVVVSLMDGFNKITNKLPELPITTNFSNIGKFKVVINNMRISVKYKNNEIYCKNSEGYEEWWEYDKDNNKIHSKNSDGYERWWKYDKNNNSIHCKYSSGYEEWWKYDNNGNLVYYRDSDGDEE